MKLDEIYKNQLNEIEGLGGIDNLAVDMLHYSKHLEIRIRNIPDIRIPTNYKDRSSAFFREIEKHLELTKEDEMKLYDLIYPGSDEKITSQHFAEVKNKLDELTITYINLVKSLALEYIEKDKAFWSEFMNDVRTGDIELIRKKYIK